MKVALISFNPVWEEKEINKQACELLIKEAADDHCEMVIFPEMTLTGFTMNSEKLAEDAKDSSTIHFFSNQARINCIKIVFGVILLAEKKYENHAVLCSSDGTVLASYAKIHPFSFASENLYYSRGSHLSITNLENCTIGLTICYDLRFPEIFQGLSKESNIIINIANWPAKRVDHWITLLKARAIENQVFMIGVNRIGVDGNSIEYEQSTAVFDSLGNEVNSIFIKNHLHIVEFEPSTVNISRAEFPVKNDRDINFYKSIL